MMRINVALWVNRASAAVVVALLLCCLFGWWVFDLATGAARRHARAMWREVRSFQDP